MMTSPEKILYLYPIHLLVGVADKCLIYWCSKKADNHQKLNPNCLETAQNISEYEEKQQVFWGRSAISITLLDYLFGTRLAVQNCGELSQYLAHIV